MSALAMSVDAYCVACCLIVLAMGLARVWVSMDRVSPTLTISERIFIDAMARGLCVVERER